MTNIIKNAVNPYYSEIYNTLNPIPPGPVTLRHYHRKNKQGTCISLAYLSSSTCISNRSQFHSSPPLRSRFSALCFSSNPGNIYPFPKYSNNTHTHIYNCMCFDFEFFHMGFYLFLRLFCIYLGFMLLKLVSWDEGHCGNFHVAEMRFWVSWSVNLTGK